MTPKVNQRSLGLPLTPPAQGTRMGAPQFPSVECGFAGPGCHRQGPGARAAAPAAASGSPGELQQQGHSTGLWGDTAPSGAWRSNTEPKRSTLKSLRADGASLARL